jgi:predicted nucleotidyltransferase
MEIGERLGAVFAQQAETGIVSAYLFGSEPEGRAHRESDVDVGVLLAADRFPSEKERFEVRLRLAGDCTEALRGREVDLNLLNDVPPLFARQIVLRGQRIFCADPLADQRFVHKSILLAADLEPWLRHFRERKLHYLTSATSRTSGLAP